MSLATSSQIFCKHNCANITFSNQSFRNCWYFNFLAKKKSMKICLSFLVGSPGGEIFFGMLTQRRNRGKFVKSFFSLCHLPRFLAKTFCQTLFSRCFCPRQFSCKKHFHRRMLCTLSPGKIFPTLKIKNSCLRIYGFFIKLFWRGIKEDEIKLCKYANTFSTHILTHIVPAPTNKYFK